MAGLDAPGHPRPHSAQDVDEEVVVQVVGTPQLVAADEVGHEGVALALARLVGHRTDDVTPAVLAVLHAPQQVPGCGCSLRPWRRVCEQSQLVP